MLSGINHPIKPGHLILVVVEQLQAKNEDISQQAIEFIGQILSSDNVDIPKKVAE